MPEAPPGTPPAGEAAPPEPPPPADTAATTPPAEGALPAVDPVTGQPIEGAAGTGLAAGGWVIELKGYHLHNNLPDKNINVGDEGEQFVTHTLLKSLRTGSVMLPDGPGGKLIEVPIADLGIQYPVVVTQLKTQTVTYMAEPIDPNSPGGMPMAGPGLELSGAAIGGVPGQQVPKTFKLRQYDFIVQFCWQPEPRGKRIEKMAQKKNAAPAAAEPSTAAVGTEPDGTGPSS